MTGNWKKGYVKNILSSVSKMLGNTTESDLGFYNYYIKKKLESKPENGKLYKYVQTKEEDKVRSLCEGNILIKNREELNDPFDGIFLIKKMNEDELLEYEWNENKSSIILDLRIKTFEDWKKTTKQIPNLLQEVLINHRNDIDELNRSRRISSCIFGSSSFSEVSPKERYSLLWSHYANSGKGLCFEYDITSKENSEIFKNHIHPVHYDENLLQIPLQNITKETMYIYMMQALCWKLNIWQYEAEWRYLDFNSLTFRDTTEKERFLTKFPTNKEKFNIYTEPHIATEHKIKPSKVYYLKQLFCETNIEMLKKMDIETEEVNLFNL